LFSQPVDQTSPPPCGCFLFVGLTCCPPRCNTRSLRLAPKITTGQHTCEESTIAVYGRFPWPAWFLLHPFFFFFYTNPLFAEFQVSGSQIGASLLFPAWDESSTPGRISFLRVEGLFPQKESSPLLLFPPQTPSSMVFIPKDKCCTVDTDFPRPPIFCRQLSGVLRRPPNPYGPANRQVKRKLFFIGHPPSSLVRTVILSSL